MSLNGRGNRNGLPVIYRLALCGLIAVSCRGDDHGVRLSFNYTPGEIYLYEMTDDVIYETVSCEGEVTRVSHNQKQLTRIHVQPPDSLDDVYRLRVSFVIVADTMIYPPDLPAEKRDRRRSKVGKVMEYTLAMRQNGEITRVIGKNKSSTEYYERAYTTRQPVFPDRELKPGDKWKHTIYLNIPDNEPIPVVIKYKFAGYEKVNGYQCAIIKYFSTFEKKSDLTATKWNRDKNYRRWLAHYRTQSAGKLYFAYRAGLVAETEATITIDTKYDIIEADGSSSHFTRRTTDHEIVRLKSVQRDSTMLSNRQIFY